MLEAEGLQRASEHATHAVWQNIYHYHHINRFNRRSQSLLNGFFLWALISNSLL
jgi:hypothetical protein